MNRQSVSELLWECIKHNIPVQTVYAQVQSVDKDTHTCNCLKLDDETPINDVQLTAVAQSQDSFEVTYPKIGSTVILGIINNQKEDAFVLKVSQWESIAIVNEGLTIALDKEHIQADFDGTLFKLTKDQLSFKKGNTEINAADKILLKVNAKSLGAVLDTLLQKLATAQVLTPAGPGSFKPDTIADIQTAKTDLANILQS